MGAHGDSGPAPLLSVEEHLAQVLAGVGPLPVRETPLADAIGLRCAAPVVSPVALPRFDNSAMDGYAVRAAEVVGAREEAPVLLPVIGAIGAGQVGVTRLEPGVAAKIMTGAPMPEGADAVVPYEWTDQGAEEVRISAAPQVHQHVRDAGDDVVEGEVLLEAGTVLGPRQIGLLAAVGLATVAVRPRPRVLVVSTGSELREAGTALDSPDAIHDGNSHLLAAAVQRAGGLPRRLGIVPDDPERFLVALREALPGADAVVTSGGVSMGDYDVVKAALRPLGVWFGGLAMQPGKPQGFGLLDDDGRPVPLFALPGNPVSSYISCELFVRPALRTMAGLAPLGLPVVRARLTDAVRSPQGRRQFLRGVYDAATGTATATVRPVGGSGSHLVGDLAHADALIVVPEEAAEVAAGSEVDVVRLDALEEAP